MRRAKRIRNRMVDVAELGGPVAIGEAARHIPGPDERLQRRGRAVTRLRRNIIAKLTQESSCAPRRIRSASSGAGTVPPPVIIAAGRLSIGSGSGSGANASASVISWVIGRDLIAPDMCGSSWLSSDEASATTWMTTLDARSSAGAPTRRPPRGSTR